MAAAREGRKKLAWVKGHSSVMGNELEDLRAKKGVWEGVRRGEKNIATAGEAEAAGSFENYVQEGWLRSLLRVHPLGAEADVGLDGCRSSTDPSTGGLISGATD